MIPLSGYIYPQYNEDSMIPATLLKTAEAEYFCNVSEFVGLGEGRALSPRDICAIKMRYPFVQDWVGQLSPKGRLQIIDYVQREYERSNSRLVISL